MKTFSEEQIKTLDYRSWLAGEFTRRCKSNPSYSMRAFAKLLGLDSSTVSQILSGKRKASGKMIAKICKKLGARPEVKEALVNFANVKSKKNQVDLETDNQYRQLTLDAYALIADWYHYAILEFTFVDGFKSSPRWIASKLGITTDEVKIAIERLKRLDLLEERDGKFYKTETFITNFSEGVTSSGLKELQKSVLQLALDAIDNTPQEEKDITSMTLAINIENLPQAREEIKEFRRKITKLLETGHQTRVYNLGIQLYPISKK